jgi:hypothetical protein
MPSTAHRVRKGPDKAHDRSITTEAVDVMWGTDMSQTVTLAEGVAHVFVAVDHCNSECVGIHADKSANRFQALEPVRQGVRQHFGAIGKDVAAGLKLRHDHGSNYMSTGCAPIRRSSWPALGYPIPAGICARNRPSRAGRMRLPRRVSGTPDRRDGQAGRRRCGRLQLEQVAGFNWNRWPTSLGIGGRLQRNMGSCEVGRGGVVGGLMGSGCQPVLPHQPPHPPG